MAEAKPALLSPVRSALAVLAGFVALGVLNLLFIVVARTTLGSLFPPNDAPASTGLALMLVAGVFDGVAAGLVTSRIAGHAPFAHAAALIGVFGIYTVGAIEQAQGLPGWYVIGLVLASPLGALIGATITHVQARPK